MTELRDIDRYEIVESALKDASYVKEYAKKVLKEIKGEDEVTEELARQLISLCGSFRKLAFLYQAEINNRGGVEDEQK